MYFGIGVPLEDKRLVVLEDAKLLVMLDAETTASDDDDDEADTIELPEPRRLVEVEDDSPPKPEKSWLAGRDSSGNR